MARAAPAGAHGFGQRFDLPLPLWLWVTGAGATIALTFIVMALFVREQRPALSRIPLGRFGAAPVRVLRVVTVIAFLLSLAAGFFGAQDPYRNLLPTMVWVLWWVGFAFVCALIGDLWKAASPLSTLHRWVEPLWKSRPRTYPSWLGAWPAVLLFLAFAWAELVWRDNDVPSRLAWAVLAYSAITWAGMFVYGRETWLGRGEAFSLAFGLLGRFAPLEGTAGELRLRPPGAGLVAEGPVPFSVLVFVILMLATVTFDGFLETPLHQQWSTAVQSVPVIARVLFALSELGLDESEVIATLALLLFPLAFLAVYWLTSWAAARLSGIGTRQVACSFVLSLVPIAVAYHLSHYFSLLLTAGQFIIPLASDPFGYGWDLFGTARYKVDLGIVSPYVFWYGAVALIVLGHVIAVYLAHLEAVRVFGRRALASELPLVALMVGYTTLSLWILAQPIVG